MLKKFIEENKKENLNSTLITYSDASTFTGRIYEKLGMTEYNMTECGYSYVDENAYKSSGAFYAYGLILVDYSGNRSEVVMNTQVIHDNVSSVKRTWGSIKALFR